MLKMSEWVCNKKMIVSLKIAETYPSQTCVPAGEGGQ